MPTSVPYSIPIVAGVARQLRPRSILDVGIGFGKYGFVLREYTDIWDMTSVAQYDRTQWKTRIDGIDATPEYITPMHRFIYDEIHVGDVRTSIDALPSYDLIVMGDLLEHFEKNEGFALIEKLLAHASKCVLLIFPQQCAINHEVLDNPLEAHRSSWTGRDFHRFAHRTSKVIEDYSCVVALAKTPQYLPLLTPHFAARRRTGWKQTLTELAVRGIGASWSSRLASWTLGRKVTLRTCKQ